jgi:acetyl-CoA carboxylase biotin carboxylase subunit
MIRKILIANRGEIALRILRACREMGIGTVAVYSSADKEALHVQLADEAICIGGPLSSQSYLNMTAIIQAACSTGCDAIHPGFGFLSENAMFAKLCEACGLIFIGPKAATIEKLGHKTAARNAMKEAGVPIIEGCAKPIESKEELFSLAQTIGYPLILKACAGGGGKGMRIVWDEQNLYESFVACQQEAKACFGSDEVYMEKYLQNPKHIEVQVAADVYGNVIHLFERDCSFQIRNQKMIEEAPCSILSDEKREALCMDAVRACKSIGYESLGTVEFLLDATGQHYFMEMNTRIQVEHPITEAITDIDLVKLQIRLANKEEMPYKQEDIQLKGHAIECRINAEDVQKNFAPAAGTVGFLHLPGGRGIRIDTALYAGYSVPPFYDSMLCKIIAHDKDRESTLAKMKQALSEVIIEGVPTNEDFHFLVMQDEEFTQGNYSTSYASKIAEKLVSHEII